MKLNSPLSYSLVTGLVLFGLGVFGFAFRSNFNIADKYLFLSLVFGFWGLVVASTGAGQGQK